jgi:dGTP triphosphohydrolase
MAETITPAGMMMSGGGDSLFGGNGLIGGLILGSLLRNNGNLFGNDGAGAAAAALRSPPEQAQANMDLMAAIAGVSKDVAISTSAMEASQAQQSSTIQAQLSSVAQATVAQVNGVKDSVNAGTMVLAQQLNGIEKSIMENRYELSKDISADGDKTRALLVQQYEAALNRQLSDANAAVIALQAKLDNSTAARGVEVTTTNNINQMQQQQQQQQQWGQLYNAIWGLAQNIRSNNEAINVGSGTLTASPTNTNTNIR